jgi:hypothetical protein
MTQNGSRGSQNGEGRPPPTSSRISCATPTAQSHNTRPPATWATASTDETAPLSPSWDQEHEDAPRECRRSDHPDPHGRHAEAVVSHARARQPSTNDPPRVWHDAWSPSRSSRHTAVIDSKTSRSARSGFSLSGPESSRRMPMPSDRVASSRRREKRLGPMSRPVEKWTTCAGRKVDHPDQVGAPAPLRATTGSRISGP